MTKFKSLQSQQFDEARHPLWALAGPMASGDGAFHSGSEQINGPDLPDVAAGVASSCGAEGACKSPLTRHYLWEGNQRIEVTVYNEDAANDSSDDEDSTDPPPPFGGAGWPVATSIEGEPGGAGQASLVERHEALAATLSQVRRALEISQAAPSPEEVPWPEPSKVGEARTDLQKEIVHPEGQDLAVCSPRHGPSVGSELHSAGECRPCFFVVSKKGCQFGSSCAFCHKEHPKKRKQRPPKHVRMEVKNLAWATFKDRADMSQDMVEAHLRTNEVVNGDQVTSQYAAVVLRALYRSTQHSIQWQ
mmetsp:Transcript_74487/g.205529  ORF Transcript_74487/g.205529 Transcript_74487/m.205529 type:complete len:304 (-) Transcript_74487:185-1096(-)